MMTRERFENFAIPVPRKPVKGIKEDPFSKKLRHFDNLDIQFPLQNHSGVYINTNESGTSAMAKILSDYPSILEPFHIGFSGWHNFDIIAQRHSSRALICDVNPENTLFLTSALKYLRLFENKSLFINKMTAFVNKYRYVGYRINTEESLHVIKPKSIKFSINVSDEYPYPESVTISEEIILEEKRQTSWLYTDERYAHIRKLALDDKIAVITESICNNSVFLNMANLLSNNCVQIDTIYLSNISEWMFSETERKQFIDSLKYLLSDNQTILIHAKYDNEQNTLIQQCLSDTLADKKHVLKNRFFSSHSSPLEEENQHPATNRSRLGVT